jgi:hypothetical protein
MVKLDKGFPTDSSFWDTYPDFKLPFKDVYDKDKSKGKKDSSNLMWAISLLNHRSSVYYDLVKEEKERLLEEMFLTQGYFFANEEYVETLSFKFNKFTQDTPANRQLKALEDVLEKRTKFIEGLEYSTVTWEMIDKMLGASPKIFADYQRVKKMLDDEKADSSVYGGASLSLLEQDDESN